MRGYSRWFLLIGGKGNAEKGEKKQPRKEKWKMRKGRKDQEENHDVEIRIVKNKDIVRKENVNSHPRMLR